MAIDQKVRLSFSKGSVPNAVFNDTRNDRHKSENKYLPRAAFDCELDSAKARDVTTEENIWRRIRETAEDVVERGRIVESNIGTK